MPYEQTSFDAGFTYGNPVIADVNPGEVIIRTPEAAAAENDATILELLRQMFGNQEQQDNLAGKDICLQWTEPCVPVFWGQKRPVIEGKICKVMHQDPGLWTKCHTAELDALINLRPCDLVTATSIKIDLDEPLAAEIPVDTPGATTDA